MTAQCADCNLPATGYRYAGWVCVGGLWMQMTRPLCDLCGHEDARERAEARSA